MEDMFSCLCLFRLGQHRSDVDDDDADGENGEGKCLVSELATFTKQTNKPDVKSFHPSSEFHCGTHCLGHIKS